LLKGYPWSGKENILKKGTLHGGLHLHEERETHIFKDLMRHTKDFGLHMHGEREKHLFEKHLLKIIWVT